MLDMVEATMERSVAILVKDVVVRSGSSGLLYICLQPCIPASIVMFQPMNAIRIPNLQMSETGDMYIFLQTHDMSDTNRRRCNTYHGQEKRKAARTIGSAIVRKDLLAATGRDIGRGEDVNSHNA